MFLAFCLVVACKKRPMSGCSNNYNVAVNTVNCIWVFELGLPKVTLRWNFIALESLLSFNYGQLNPLFYSINVTLIFQRKAIMVKRLAPSCLRKYARIVHLKSKSRNEETDGLVANLCEWRLSRVLSRTFPRLWPALSLECQISQCISLAKHWAERGTIS